MDGNTAWLHRLVSAYGAGNRCDYGYGRLVQQVMESQSQGRIDGNGTVYPPAVPPKNYGRSYGRGRSPLLTPGFWGPREGQPPTLGKLMEMGWKLSCPARNVSTGRRRSAIKKRAEQREQLESKARAIGRVGQREPVHLAATRPPELREAERERDREMEIKKERKIFSVDGPSLLLGCLAK